MIVSKEEALSLKQEHPSDYRFIDKTGIRFGMLTSLHYAGRSEKRSKNQFACLCDCGNYCLVTSVNLNSTTVGCGCLQTSNVWALHEAQKISVRDTEDWVHANTPYLVICENPQGTRSKWTFYCKEHGVFKANLNLLKRDRIGCPECRPGGGYRDNQPGILYVNKVFKDGNPIAIKFGITNISTKQRIYQTEFSANKSVKIENVYELACSDGVFIKSLEDSIKKQFKTKVITKEILPVGYTETVSLEDEENLIQWLSAATNKR